MAIKKFIVHVSYHTCYDAVVYADENMSDEEVIELGAAKAAEDNEEVKAEILSNCVEDGNTEILEKGDIFSTKEEAYNTLLDRVEDAGGYIGFNILNRPRLKFEDEEGQSEDIVAISIFVGKDNSSPLKIVDVNGFSWDVDDYLSIEQITELYCIVQNY